MTIFTRPDYFRRAPHARLLTTFADKRVRYEGVRMNGADHYSWEEVYDLFGCNAELEPPVEC